MGAAGTVNGSPGRAASRSGAAAAAPLLRVRGLTTEFGSGPSPLRAVDGVSFEVDAGETLAIVGESGSGKSVTALSIMRLITSPPGRISGGEVLFEGRDLLKLSDAEMRGVRGDRIAMVFQEPMSSLNPSLKVGLQIAEPINLHRGVPWRRAIDRAKALLGRVRIPDAGERVEAYPHQFSGGMRQRIMIAMGLACEPRLIIADEPTTALDVTVQAQILSLLKELTRDARAGLILITHDLGVVARYADRVCVMYAGRVAEIGRARDVYGRPCHPYTRGLMASVPRLDQPAGERLVPIAGQPPNLADLPPGCAFHPRCPWAMPRCRAETPPLEPAEPGHLKACWAAHGGG